MKSKPLPGEQAVAAESESQAPVVETPPQDEYAGIGGSYIVDPETGKRKPAAE